MNKIILSSNNVSQTTVISNVFIDSYMPYANGEYVKVYIYLLRCFSCGTMEFSLSQVADHLDNTETDIMRALNHWEKVNLVELAKDEKGQITHIALLDPVNPQPVPAKTVTAARANQPTYGNDVVSEVAATVVEAAPVNTSQFNPPVYEKPVYTDAQVAELMETDEIKWLMNIIEIYLERLLTPTDVQLVLFIYETLGFSTELIMHLYEYCVSKGKKNPAYIEKVAIAWAEEGIDSIDKAEVSTSKYNTNYNAITKAFGLNRQLGDIEKQYIDKWANGFKFEISIIVEACNRTLLRTGKPDFKYADKILENWHNKGVKRKEDIDILDKKHNDKAASYQAQKAQTNVAPKSTNQFNAFPQRSYSKEDFSSLEQRLLNK